MIIALMAGPLVSSIAAAAQDTSRAANRQLPTPTDTNPRLTAVLQPLEQNLADAILRKDVKTVERLVTLEFTLRSADDPQGSTPRAVWIDDLMNRLKRESLELEHCVARELAANLAVVSLVYKQHASIDGRNLSGQFYLVDIWKQHSGSWQVVARYISPVGIPVDRGSHPPLPAPNDIDAQLTETLGQLEQRLAAAALGGFKDTEEVERLVAAEFTLRVSDAPERSLPRALWGQASSAYKMESLAERFYAARKVADNVAIVSMLLTQKATRDGQDRSGDFYVVDIWKSRDDRWQLIARYSSPLGKTFDRAPPR